MKPVLFRSWAALGEAFDRQLDVVHLLMPMAVQLRYALGGGVRDIGWNHTSELGTDSRPAYPGLSDLAGSQLAIPFYLVVDPQHRAADGRGPTDCNR